MSGVCTAASGGSGGASSNDSTSSGGGTTNTGCGGTTTTTDGGSSTGGGAGEVSDAAIIDNFSSCDGKVSVVAGRDGSWYTFGDDDVNVAPTSGIGAGSAPSGFSDSTSCAAWITAGCESTDTSCSYAGLGVAFKSDEAPVDLSSYDGFTVQMEGDEVWVIVHMTESRAFGTTIPAAAGAQASRSVHFADLVPSGDTPEDATPDFAAVIKIEFTAVDPSAFGLAIWDMRMF